MIQAALPPSMPAAPTPASRAGGLSPNVDFGGGPPVRAQPSPTRQPPPDFLPPPLIPQPSPAVPLGAPPRQPPQEAATPDELPQRRPAVPAVSAEQALPIRDEQSILGAARPTAINSGHHCIGSTLAALTTQLAHETAPLSQRDIGQAKPVGKSFELCRELPCDSRLVLACFDEG